MIPSIKGLFLATNRYTKATITKTNQSHSRLEPLWTMAAAVLWRYCCTTYWHGR